VPAEAAELDDPLDLKSSVALVVDQDTNEVLFSKNPGAVLPIASITKLMTALVVAEAKLSLDETTDDHPGRHRHREGQPVAPGGGHPAHPRRDAAPGADVLGEPRRQCAGPHHPGGMQPFVDAMNHKAAALGMARHALCGAHWLVQPQPVQRARPGRAGAASYEHPLLRELSTSQEAQVAVGSRRVMQFRNTNGLVRNPNGRSACRRPATSPKPGRCVVMQAQLAGRKLIMVLLDSAGKYSRIGDAERIRKWLASAAAPVARLS
jgi:D-alanyl-D-alanine endopeptidase (penicillin-binding protein 7)